MGPFVMPQAMESLCLIPLYHIAGSLFSIYFYEDRKDFEYLKLKKSLIGKAREMVQWVRVLVGHAGKVLVCTPTW